jgi:anoctamin-1
MLHIFSFQAFIIAFSSSFIPRIVYTMKVSPDHTDVGFLNHSLAYFDTRDFQHPQTNVCYVEVCR